MSVKAGKMNGRVEYTHEEDVRIVKFLAEANAWRDTSGNNIWKKMVLKNICPNRTFQSLRNRYLRNISYRLTRDFSSLFKDGVPKDLKKKTIKLELSVVTTSDNENNDENEEEQQTKNRRIHYSSSSSDTDIPPRTEPVVLRSRVVDGWTEPHFTGPSTSNANLSRKRLFDENDDLFEAEEAAVAAAKKISPSPTRQSRRIVLLNDNQNSFVSPCLNLSPVTQIVEPSPVIIGNAVSLTVPKRKKRKNKLLEFQTKINRISRQMFQAQKKYEAQRRKLAMFSEFIKNCLTNDVAPLAAIEVRDVVAASLDGSEREKSLLGNMLRSLSDSQRKAILSKTSTMRKTPKK